MGRPQNNQGIPAIPVCISLYQNEREALRPDRRYQANFTV